MRGPDEQQESMHSYISPEKRVPSGHPLRGLRGMVDTALKEMSPQFAELYSHFGRPSIAPKKLLRALLLQVLYSVRSDRCQQVVSAFVNVGRVEVRLFESESRRTCTFQGRVSDLLQSDAAHARKGLILNT